jgi:transposase
MNFAPTEQPFESTDTGQWQVEKRAFQQVVFTLNQALAERDLALAKNTLELTEKQAELTTKTTEVIYLKVQLETLRRLKFSRSSERFDPAQQQMFEEDTSVDIADVEAQIEAAIAPSPRAAAVRAKPVRKPLPAHLPRVIRRLPAPCDCAECGGVLHHVRDEVSEKLDVKPAEFFVVHTLRPVMGCRRCDKVITTPTQPEIIDGGIPTPGLLAHVLISKYVDHVPLYRQRDIARRSEIDLPISTTSEWVGHCGTALKPLATAP